MTVYGAGNHDPEQSDHKGGAKERESPSISQPECVVTPEIADWLLRALYSHGVNGRLADRGIPVMPLYQIELLQGTKVCLATERDKKHIRDRRGDDMFYFWGRLIKQYANSVIRGFNTEAQPDGTWVITNEGKVLVRVVDERDMGTVCTVKLTNLYEKSEARFRRMRGGLLDESDPFTIDCQQSDDPHLKVERYRVEFHRGKIKMFSAQEYNDNAIIETRYSFD